MAHCGTLAINNHIPCTQHDDEQDGRGYLADFPPDKVEHILSGDRCYFCADIRHAAAHDTT